MKLRRHLPIASWLQSYSRSCLPADLLAALIMVAILVPQTLAYALLAGLPPQAGLYSSILPLVVYAVFGSSSTLSIGPMAVLSLMTAKALAGAQSEFGIAALDAAMILTLLVGGFSLALGLMRMGFLANFLSHPVISGFITASGLIIALSQLGPLLGISGGGDTLPEIATNLWQNASAVNFHSLLIGGLALAFLLWARTQLTPLLKRSGLQAHKAALVARTAPAAVVALSALAVWVLGMERDLAVVGAIPNDLPDFNLPRFDLALAKYLSLPALMIAIIGYVGSVSVGKTLAVKRQERLDLNQEFVALGAANLASAVSGGFPVTASLSRSMVNFEAGATSQMAGLLTAAGVILCIAFVTPALYFLPKTVLAAVIIVSVIGLMDLDTLRKTFGFAKKDFTAVAVTLLLTLFAGVEAGVTAGVGVSLVLHLYRTSRPHIAEVGLVEGTQHFRNVRHFKVKTQPCTLCLRVDESLYFANASYLEDRVMAELARRLDLKHVVLVFSAVNEVDFSAVESLQALNKHLQQRGVCLHLSEVKSPVMQRLNRSNLPQELSGRVFLTQFQAFEHLGREPA